MENLNHIYGWPLKNIKMFYKHHQFYLIQAHANLTFCSLMLPYIVWSNHVLTHTGILHIRQPKTNYIQFRHFLTTQFNYVALVREAFLIYIPFKRLNLYLQDEECMVLCNHKQFQKFIKGKAQKINKMLGQCSPPPSI